MKPEQKRKQRERKKANLQRAKAKKKDEKIENFRKYNSTDGPTPGSLSSFDSRSQYSDQVTTEYELPDLPFSIDDARFDEFKAAFGKLNVDDEMVVVTDQDGQSQDLDGMESSTVNGSVNGTSDANKKSRQVLRQQIQEVNKNDKERNLQGNIDDDNDMGNQGQNQSNARNKMTYLDENGRWKTKKTKKKINVPELKALTMRPDVVTEVDTTSPDPLTLVYLKSYRNTVTVPDHWQNKRRYLATKKGMEKSRYKLPPYIEATGIAKIRQAVLERDDKQGIKGQARNRLTAKMGKLDIDYQVLHDAFFRYQTKPRLTGHNDIYNEHKETQEIKMTNGEQFRPGNKLSSALLLACGMTDPVTSPPPWLFNMQRYGPPPAYPQLKIPGLNAPIPEGCMFGSQPGGWGKPPVDAEGKPRYGDWKAGYEERARKAQIDDSLWGEVQIIEDDDDPRNSSSTGGPGGNDGTSSGTDSVSVSGSATPGLTTPYLAGGHITPGSASGVMSIMSSSGHHHGSGHGTHGISSIASHGGGGIMTPGIGIRSVTRGIQSIQSITGGHHLQAGLRSSALTPGPQLFHVLEEQKRSMGIASSGISSSGIPGQHGQHNHQQQLFPSSHGYQMPGTNQNNSNTGIQTPIARGVQTPAIGGIATPIGGIATPAIGGHGGGIATPIGGIASSAGGNLIGASGVSSIGGGIGIHGIGGTQSSLIAGGINSLAGGISSLGVGGLAGGIASVSAHGGIRSVEQEGIFTADMIRQQLKAHEEKDRLVKERAGQKDGGAGKKKKKNTFKF